MRPEVQQLLLIAENSEQFSDTSPVKPHLEDSLSSARGNARHAFEILRQEHNPRDLEDI
jgi:hypothetical protein